MPILCVPMFNFAPLGEEEEEKDEDEDEDEEGGGRIPISEIPQQTVRENVFFFSLLSSPNHLARGTHGRERRCVVSGGFFNYKSAEPA